MVYNSRSKICNSKQINWKFGCLFCYHPGQTVDKRNVYNFRECLFRTKNDYDRDVLTAEGNKQPFNGIKSILYFCNYN